MSIDKIGKGAGVTGAGSTTPATSAGQKAVFEVDKTASTTPAGAVSPADRVRSGELDVRAYVELRVDEATKHLQGKLGPADLERVKDHLRTQIAEDPTVREMVKAATGVEPPAEES